MRYKAFNAEMVPICFSSVVISLSVPVCNCFPLFAVVIISVRVCCSSSVAAVTVQTCDSFTRSMISLCDSSTSAVCAVPGFVLFPTSVSTVIVIRTGHVPISLVAGHCAIVPPGPHRDTVLHLHGPHQGVGTKHGGHGRPVAAHHVLGTTRWVPHPLHASGGTRQLRGVSGPPSWPLGPRGTVCNQQKHQGLKNLLQLLYIHRCWWMYRVDVLENR